MTLTVPTPTIALTIGSLDILELASDAERCRMQAEKVEKE